MKIGIDITPVIYERGVSRYTANLVRSFAKLKTQDSLIAFGSSLRGHHRFDPYIPGNVQASLHHYPPRLLNFLFNQLNWPIEKFTGSLDVFHAWDWYIPPTKEARIVSTVHDLALFKFPTSAHPQIKNQHQRALLKLRESDAQVIAVSASTKKDLIELFDFDERAIAVIHEALPEESKIDLSAKEVEATLQKFTIQQPFFLCVGVNEPRKNFNRVIQAWQKYKKDYLLVIAGADGWGHLTADDGLITTGHVNASDLAALYQSANLFLYPSLYEGFGLPILEAFYHKTPVVTSDVSSMPEVAGNAAVLVDPMKVESISAGIAQALRHSQALITKGQKRLAAFSWEKTARDTLKVYIKATG